MAVGGSRKFCGFIVMYSSSYVLPDAPLGCPPANSSSIEPTQRTPWPEIMMKETTSLSDALRDCYYMSHPDVTFSVLAGRPGVERFSRKFV